MENETLLTLGLMLLVLIGAVQGVQIYNIQNGLGGDAAEATGYISAPQAQPQSQTPSYLQSLPQQVGGC